MNTPALAIHAGAGDWREFAVDAAFERAARAGLEAALDAGSQILAQGGAALDAAVAAIRVLEEEPSFNAARGASLTSAGHAELDAAVHDGATGKAGAVCSFKRTRSPILAAKLVMERSGHVLMAGADAEAWCLAQGLEAVDPAWFVTPHMTARLQQVLAGRVRGPGGTVGAVARDHEGRLAAATSTGGLTGKRPGRVGDTPVIGAGTWADHRAAVSASGEGEAFIRAVFGFRTAVAIAAGRTPLQAAFAALDLAVTQGGSGGCIVMPALGDPVAAYLTPDLARGFWTPSARRTALFGSEGDAAG